MSWIEFAKLPLPLQKKTDEWSVLSNGPIKALLGIVKWYGPWRKYCFFPNQANSTVFDAVCLQDIAGFCTDETKKYREKKNGGL